MYERKTVDVWEIQELYDGVWEMVTTEASFQDAKTNIKLYKENEPNQFKIVKKREKVTQRTGKAEVLEDYLVSVLGVNLANITEFKQENKIDFFIDGFYYKVLDEQEAEKARQENDGYISMDGKLMHFRKHYVVDYN